MNDCVYPSRPASRLTRTRYAIFGFASAALLAACTGTPPPDAGMDVVTADTGPAGDGAVSDATGDAPNPSGRTAVTTFQFDRGRSGANRSETTLTIAAVTAGFGRDMGFAPTLDGDVYAQPLYLPNITVMGAAHDTLFVATQANSIFALDALTGATLWTTSLGTPVSRTTQPCGNITPQTGVLGTPVIDAASGTLYAVSFALEGSTKVFSINALEVATGAQRAGYPQPIRPPTNNGTAFDPNPTGERGASLLLDGRIYVPFGGLYGDCGNFHGWVVGIDTADPTHQTAWATPTPGRGSGIWAPGGISADPTGNIFAATGNGFTGASMGEYVVKLQSGTNGPTLATGPQNFFSPSDRLALDAMDQDIGSVAPLILPDHTGSATPHLAFQPGKVGVGYLVNREDLGGNSTGNGITGEAVYSQRIFSGGVYGSTATWSDGTNVYIFSPGSGTRSTPCTGSAGVMALRLGLTGTSSTFAPVWCTGSISNASPAISSNGNSDGILWVSGGTNTLRAYNISDGTEIFAATDSPGVRKWSPPVIADGRVYVTTAQSVTMYRTR